MSNLYSIVEEGQRQRKANKGLRDRNVLFSFDYTSLIAHTFSPLIITYILVDMQYAYGFHLPLTTTKNSDQRNCIATEMPYLTYKLRKSNVCTKYLGAYAMS